MFMNVLTYALKPPLIILLKFGQAPAASNPFSAADIRQYLKHGRCSMMRAEFRDVVT